MDFEFDKEIDALLRKARDGGSEDAATTVTAAHLDADELSAFAENALPDAARKHYTAHLAECTRCRKILSNLISLNSEAGTQSAFSTFPAGVAAAPAPPWYRRLFAFPQVAYAMGALVLLFSGFMAYIVLQTTGSSEFSIAQKEETGERPRGAGGINSDGGSVPTFAANANANAVANTANSAAVSNTATGNSNAMTVTSTAANTAGSSTTFNTNSTANAAVPAARQTPPTEEKELAKNEPKPTLAENYAATPQATPPPTATNATATVPKDDVDTKRSAAVRDKEKAEDTQRSEAAMQAQGARPVPSAPSKKVARPRADATRAVGGKTFRRVDSAWVDSEYQQGGNPQGNLMLPPLRYVRRGSDEYKKLDGGLKDIAEKLDGIVIVVWKNKGYRIQ